VLRLIASAAATRGQDSPELVPAFEFCNVLSVERAKTPAHVPRKSRFAAAKKSAPRTIFGSFFLLELQRLPEKSSFRAVATAEFCRLKIDFRQNRTKPPVAGSWIGQFLSRRGRQGRHAGDRREPRRHKSHDACNSMNPVVLDVPPRFVPAAPGVYGGSRTNHNKISPVS
jgi:hypothetical protein